jgi:sugar lactone lactonase YvrE
MSRTECVVACGDQLGECATWDARTKKVWWVDILAPALQSFDPASGEHRRYPLPGSDCGSFALRKSGGFLLAMSGGLHGFDPATGALQFLVDPEPGVDANRLNDGRADRAGRFWVGSMQTEMLEPEGSLYRIEPDLRVTRMMARIEIPNSIAWSPDDRTFYFADSRRRLIWAFDFDLASGAINHRRVFARLDGEVGGPDGSCVDADGFLWNAQFRLARVVRYAPDGRIDRVIPIPTSNPTSCCFGGDKLDTLYVTTAWYRMPADRRAAEPLAGGLFAVDVGVRGRPEPMFGG